MFVFGEKRCYRRLNVPSKMRHWLLRTLKIPLIVFWGRWFGWHPGERRPRRLCLERASAPPALDPGTTPTETQVDELHARYTAAVVELYEKHKADAGYGPEERALLIAGGGRARWRSAWPRFGARGPDCRSLDRLDVY